MTASGRKSPLISKKPLPKETARHVPSGRLEASAAYLEDT